MSRFSKLFSNQRAAQSLANEEHGVFIVLVAVILLALVGIIGLALDSGEMYRKRIILQKAADAAAVSTLGQLIGKHPKDWPSDGTDLIHFVEGHVRANIKLNKISEQDLSWPSDPQIDLQRERVIVDAQLQMHPMLMGLFNPGNTQVSVHTESEIGPGLLSMVIDTSSSMLCKVVAGQPQALCPCYDTDAKGVLLPKCVAQNALYHTAAEPTNLERVKEAVKSVVQRVNFKRDRISITPFNLVANVAVPTRSEPIDGKTFDPAEVKAEVDRLELYFNQVTGTYQLISQSATNICDGLIRSYLDAEDAIQNVPGLSSNVTYLFFSDGAPTASRFFLGESTGVAATTGAQRPIPADPAVYPVDENGLNIPDPYIDENQYDETQGNSSPALPLPGAVLPDFLKYDYTLWSLTWRTTDAPLNWPFNNFEVRYPTECSRSALKCCGVGATPGCSCNTASWPDAAAWQKVGYPAMSCESFNAIWETDATSPLVKTQSVQYGYQLATPPRLIIPGPDEAGLPKRAYKEDGTPESGVFLAAIERMQRLDRTYTKEGVPINLNDYYAPVVPPCSWLSVHAQPSGLQALYDSLARCVHHLGFHLPTTQATNQTTLYADDQIPDFAATAGVRKQFYHCPIAMSDVIRASGGTIYSVGLGEDPLLSCTQDAYQNVNDDKRRKDCFLRRLAFDPAWRGPDNKVGTADDDKQVSFANYKPYQTLEDEKENQGLYLNTNDPAQVDKFFTLIVQRMKLRLIK